MTEPQPLTPYDDDVSDRGIAYLEGNTIVIRASASGHCTRALVAALLGYEEARHERVEQIMSTAAHEGKLHESDILDRLRAEGYTISTPQKMLEIEVIPGVIIRGHIDGWCTGGNGLASAVVECKSMSKDRFDDWCRNEWANFNPYAWQLTAYMKGTGANDALYAVKNRNTGDIHYKVIHGLPIPWREVVKKAIAVNRAYLANTLPPCDPEIGSQERYFCPFVYLHEEDEVETETTPDGPLADLRAGMAERYHELTAALAGMKALEDERRVLGDKMASMFTAKSTRVKGWEVQRVDGSRDTLDTAALALHLGVSEKKLKDQFSKHTAYRYFKVKKKEG